MTEQEWLACTEPEKMLTFLQSTGLASQRRTRLFTAACCRRVWHLLAHEDLQAAVEAAEAHADGREGEAELKQAFDRAKSAYWGEHSAINASFPAGSEEFFRRVREHARRYVAVKAVGAGERGVYPPQGSSVMWFARQAAPDDPGRECELLREVFGNPFRPVSVAPAWQTAAALELARAAYAERHLPSGHLDSARLAILADALEEAGCEDEAVLSHLRSSGPHVRGCWALDLILGKE